MLRGYEVQVSQRSDSSSTSKYRSAKAFNGLLCPKPSDETGIKPASGPRRHPPFPEASPDLYPTLTQTLDLTQGRVGTWPATEEGSETVVRPMIPVNIYGLTLILQKALCPRMKENLTAVAKPKFRRLKS